MDGYEVSARPPTAGDLAALRPGVDVQELALRLLERCLVSAQRDGVEVEARELPASVVTALEEALDDADPAADIRVPLTCQDCGNAWSETLDPVGFAWQAVETTARRLATDVHLLARAYGWSEGEVLGLSPFRRHLYLSAVEP